MSELDRKSSELERLIVELASRIVAPRMSEFEDVWKTANAVCDRYAIGFARDLSKAA